jgi:uncharacterized protein (TIGR02284 family)
MTTTVGTENTLEDLLEDLIALDYDAADAYQAAIDRLENARFKQKLMEFKGDHLRHIEELGEILAGMGRTPPKEGDMKSLLTKGKVVMAGLIGDKAILEAMRTNEADTNTAYERAVKFQGLALTARDALQRGLEDERRHCEWILQTQKTL